VRFSAPLSDDDGRIGATAWRLEANKLFHTRTSGHARVRQRFTAALDAVGSAANLGKSDKSSPMDLAP
jgi:hypothetical protein